MKIWQKHLLSQLIKTFLFFLFCIFAIYVIVDLSMHGIRFLSQSDFAEVALYYLHMFATLLETFLSLAFLLAVMRVLFDLNIHREIVALQMAGLSKKKLLTPFFFSAGFLSILFYINSQWIAPDAQDITDEFKDLHKRKRKKNTEQTRVYSVSLEDESELVYLSFEKGKKELFDVFWIRTPNDIWHMKTLKVDSLKGSYVDHLTRNSAKQFEKTESYLTRDFPELPWDKDVVLHRFVPFENRPISTLLFQAYTDPADRGSVFSHLYYKLLMPLTPLLILLTMGPISMRYSRNLPFFLIAVCSLFGFVAFKVILDGMLILGENRVLPAALAIFTPFLLVLSISIFTMKES